MTDHTVLYDGHVLLSDHIDQFVWLDVPYSGDGHSFVLIDEEPGGNACEGNFQALELSETLPTLSKQFGNSDDLATRWVADVILHILVPQYKTAGMSGNIVAAASYTFSKGVLLNVNGVLSP